MSTSPLPTLDLLEPQDWQDYELVDTGRGQALERLGPYRLVRPEPQAIWEQGLDDSIWKGADASVVQTKGEHGGYWNYNKQIKQPWVINYHGLKCEIRLSKSRHIGVFPEQASHWRWVEEQIKSAGRPLKVINLFGYTGMATAAAARAGAEVTHVDASKHAVRWASRNIDLSGLGKASIRWLVEDARKYLQREARRQSFYDGIILDPPKFGRGPKGSVWDYFDDIPELLDLCRRVLTPNPQFVCLTSYAIQASSMVTHQALSEMMRGYSGHIKSGELVTRDSSQGHILSHALFSRWSSENG